MGDSRELLQETHQPILIMTFCRCCDSCDLCEAHLPITIPRLTKFSGKIKKGLKIEMKMENYVIAQIKFYFDGSVNNGSFVKPKPFHLQSGLNFSIECLFCVHYHGF